MSGDQSRAAAGSGRITVASRKSIGRFTRTNLPNSKISTVRSKWGSQTFKPNRSSTPVKPAQANPMSPAFNPNAVSQAARWEKPDKFGAGLKSYSNVHASEVGAKSTRAYNTSARQTIAVGQGTAYRDVRTRQKRFGFRDPKTGLFTATSQVGSRLTIHSHFRMSAREFGNLSTRHLE